VLTHELVAGNVRVRRTQVERRTPAEFTRLFRTLAECGRLANRPDLIALHPDRTVTVSYDMWIDVPRGPSPAAVRLRRAWSRPGFRAFVWTVTAVVLLFTAGQLLWLFLGDEITAGVLLILKAAGVALAVLGVLAFLAGRGGGCPGAGNHCPPGFHR
jgi:hypothetical protein